MNLLDIFVSVDQPDLWAARAQMALSLAWHIVIACFGVGLPLLVLVAEFRAQRGGGAVYDELAHRWAKVLGVPQFAVPDERLVLRGDHHRRQSSWSPWRRRHDDRDNQVLGPRSD